MSAFTESDVIACTACLIEIPGCVFNWTRHNICLSRRGTVPEFLAVSSETNTANAMQNGMKKELNHQSGITVVELLIVVVIMMVIAVFALGSFERSKQSFRREGLARELKAYLDRARTDSVKRRANTSTQMASVVLNDARSYSVNLDLNYDGVLQANEKRTIPISEQQGEIVSTGLNFPISIMFDWRGRPTAVDNLGNTVNPVFTFCELGCKTSSSTFITNDKNSSVIAISPSGDVKLDKGGYSAGTLLTPNVNTLSNQNIRESVKVNANINGNSY